MSAYPIDIPVTNPFSSTIATDGFELVHVPICSCAYPDICICPVLPTAHTSESSSIPFSTTLILHESLAM